MRKQRLLTKAVAASMAVFMSVAQLPVSAFAAEPKSVSVAGNTYTYSTEALDDSYTQIGTSGLYYKLTEGSELSGNLYGTSNLTYKEFYSGDVSSTDSFDVVTTATTGHSSGLFANMWTEQPADSETVKGYYVKGVSNVNVAVDSALYVESAILKNAGKELTGAYEEASDITLNENASQEPSQYKILNEDGSYSSKTSTIATVTDSRPILTTGSTWGEYEIDVIENSTAYLRNDRLDTRPVNSTIQGIILETTDGYKVGLEHLANIWVQPYKLSFNANNEAATMNIAKSDNTAEFKKLVSKTISKITYITSDGNYVYTFSDGVFIKPAYSEEISGTFSADMKTFTLNQVPTISNATLSVSYTVGSGRKKTSYSLYSGSVQKNVALDFSSIPADAEGGTYSVTISSDDYADISVAIPVTEQQKTQLTDLIKQAETLLKGAAADDSVLLAHKNEAEDLLTADDATSADAADLINELTELLKPYQSTEAPKPSNPDTTTASKPNTTTAAKPNTTTAAKPATKPSATVNKPATTSKKTNTKPASTAKKSSTKPATTQKKSNTTSVAKVKLAKQTAKVKANGKKKIKVSWKKNKKASGYEITYSTKKSFKGKKTITIKNNKTTRKIIKKLKSKKKYFVKVRSYKQVGKTKIYGAYSKVKTVKVK